MGYKKAKDVLPHDLLHAVQQYIDGEYLYIPRKTGNKLPWGTTTETKHTLRARNRDIVAGRLAGCSVSDLAERYCLSEKAIYKILSAGKNG